MSKADELLEALNKETKNMIDAIRRAARKNVNFKRIEKIASKSKGDAKGYQNEIKSLMDDLLLSFDKKLLKSWKMHSENEKSVGDWRQGIVNQVLGEIDGLFKNLNLQADIPDGMKEGLEIDERLSMMDDLLGGFSFRELVDTVQSNEPKQDEKAVMKVFEEILKAQVSDARAMLKKHMKDIMKELS